MEFFFFLFSCFIQGKKVDGIKLNSKEHLMDYGFLFRVRKKYDPADVMYIPLMFVPIFFFVVGFC